MAAIVSSINGETLLNQSNLKGFKLIASILVQLFHGQAIYKYEVNSCTIPFSNLPKKNN